MDNNNKHDGNRRWFLSLFTEGSKKATGADMVKMLTADGKLVEVERSVLEASKKQKASNKDIFDWMENPSKDNAN